MNDLLTSPEVCQQAGVSYRQLDYWTRTGCVRATVMASGSGSRRLYNVEVVDTLRRVQKAREYLGLGNNGRGLSFLQCLMVARLMDRSHELVAS